MADEGGRGERENNGHVTNGATGGVGNDVHAALGVGAAAPPHGAPPHGAPPGATLVAQPRLHAPTHTEDGRGVGSAASAPTQEPLLASVHVLGGDSHPQNPNAPSVGDGEAASAASPPDETIALSHTDIGELSEALRRFLDAAIEASRRTAAARHASTGSDVHIDTDAAGIEDEDEDEDGDGDEDEDGDEYGGEDAVLDTDTDSSGSVDTERIRHNTQLRAVCNTAHLQRALCASPATLHGTPPYLSYALLQCLASTAGLMRYIEVDVAPQSMRKRTRAMQARADTDGVPASACAEQSCAAAAAAAAAASDGHGGTVQKECIVTARAVLPTYAWKWHLRLTLPGSVSPADALASGEHALGVRILAYFQRVWGVA